MSCWVKTDGKETTVSMYIPYDKTPIQMPGRFASPDWSYQEKIFTSPITGATIIRFDIFGGKEETVAWIDDVSLTEMKSAKTGNLLPGGDFENEQDVTVWQAQNGSLSLDKINRYSGNSSLKFRMNEDAGELDLYHGEVDLKGYECAMAWKNVDIPLDKDKVYYFSGMTQGDGNIRTFMQIIGDKGDIIRTNKPKHYEWDALSATFSPSSLKNKSEKIVRIEICMHDKAGSIAYFDDIKLEEITPFTGIGPGIKIVEDFETGKNDCLSPRDNKFAPLPIVETSGEKPHTGKYSCSVSYQFDSNRKGASFSLEPSFAKRNMPSGTLDKIGMWIFGDGSGIQMKFGHRYRKTPSPVTVDWKGWKYIESSIKGLGWESSREFWWLTFENTTDESKKGKVYIDDIEVKSKDLYDSDAISITIRQSNPTGVYLPGKNIKIAVLLRNNTTCEQKNIEARYQIRDFRNSIVKEDEKNILKIDPGEEQEFFKIEWKPEKKGVYYLLTEILNNQTLIWKEISFGVMEPNKGWKTNPGEELFFGVCPTHIISWDEPELMGLLGVTMARIHHIDSFVGQENDPYRWALYDRLDSSYRENGVTNHQKAITVLYYKKDPDETEAMVFDIVNHYRGKVRYFSLGGEEDSLYVSYGPSHEDVFIKHFKAAYKGAKRANPDSKIGLALLNWYGVYSAYNSGRPYKCIERWLCELKGLYDFFPYQIRGGYEQLLGYEKVREYYFKKCNVTGVDVWANENVSNPVIACALFRTLNFQNYTYFCTKDYGADRTMGLLDIWDNPKSIYFQYNTAIKYLKNTEARGMVDFGKDVVCYSFERGREQIYCLWTDWTSGKTIRLKGSASSVQVIDTMDNREVIKPKKGEFTITLKDTNPIFLVSLSKLELIR